MRMSPNNINDMDLIGMKSQMSMMNLIQKIGKGKRKVSLILNKSSQRFMASFMKEFKKNILKTSDSNKMKNIVSFADYVVNNTDKKKGKKQPKVLSLLISYDEQDFLKMQIAESIKALEESRKTLKWYNIFKKMMYSSYKVQCKNMYEIIKKATI